LIVWRTDNPRAGIDTLAVATDLTLLFALLFHLAATTRTNTDAILAGLSFGTLTHAPAQTGAVLANRATIAGRVVIDLSIAVVVFAIADLGAGERRRASGPVPTDATLNSLITGSFARPGDGLVGAVEVVDIPITVVVFAVAHLFA